MGRKISPYSFVTQSPTRISFFWEKNPQNHHHAHDDDFEDFFQKMRCVLTIAPHR